MTPAQRLDADGLAWADGLVDPATCAAMLRELGYVWWTPSTVVDRDGDAYVQHTSGVRTSETAGEWWFTDPLRALVASVERAVQETFGTDPAYFEEWQATRYAPGGRFLPHLDAGMWSGSPAGERTTTVLVYLDAPEAGGATEFPCFDLTVEPRPGRVLVWRTLTPDGRVDRLMRHQACPVERGRKTTLVTWARQRRVRDGGRQIA